MHSPFQCGINHAATNNIKIGKANMKNFQNLDPAFARLTTYWLIVYADLLPFLRLYS